MFLNEMAGRLVNLENVVADYEADIMVCECENVGDHAFVTR